MQPWVCPSKFNDVSQAENQVEPTPDAKCQTFFNDHRKHILILNDQMIFNDHVNKWLIAKSMLL